MTNQNIHKVVKIEQHWLPTCQCVECVEERKRRDTTKSKTPIKSFSPEVAYALGFIPRRSRTGSLARDLLERHSK